MNLGHVCRIWSFGPRRCGPNLLINRVAELQHLTEIPRLTAEAKSDAKSNGAATPTPAANAVPGDANASAAITSAGVATTVNFVAGSGSLSQGGSPTERDREAVFLSLETSIVNGFQLACAA